MDKVPKPRPPFERTPNPQRLPSRASAEFMAEAVLRTNGITHPPVEIVELAKSVGIIAITIAPLSKAGVTHALPNGEFAVIVREQDGPERQRFTIAHEVGHRILHPAYESHGMLEQVAARGDYGIIERAVNHFAACLLMPRSWVRELCESQLWDRADLISATARHFEVSRQSAEIRIVELGHIKRKVVATK